MSATEGSGLSVWDVCDVTLYRKLYRLFNKGVRQFSLIEDGDNVLVGLSGGKDSLTLLDLLARKQRIAKPSFRVQAIHVRSSFIDYKTDTSYLLDFCNSRGVTLHVVDIPLYEKDAKEKRSPCFLCSWMRRKEMFNRAQEYGCNKIALGHHRDDIVQTALMNMSFNGRFETMAVCQQMQKFPVQIIRPLCCIREADILLWAEKNNFRKLIKLCPYDTASNRSAIKNVFEQLQQLSPDVATNIFSALAMDGKLVKK